MRRKVSAEISAKFSVSLLGRSIIRHGFTQQNFGRSSAWPDDLRRRPLFSLFFFYLSGDRWSQMLGGLSHLSDRLSRLGCSMGQMVPQFRTERHTTVHRSPISEPRRAL